MRFASELKSEAVAAPPAHLELELLEIADDAPRIEDLAEPFLLVFVDFVIALGYPTVEG